MCYTPEVLNAQLEAKSVISIQRCEHLISSSFSLHSSLSHGLKRAVDLGPNNPSYQWVRLCTPQGCLSWCQHPEIWLVTCKSPSECACGKSFSVEHTLSWPKRGFPSLRHNEVRDIPASPISECCSNVCTEPTLHPVAGHTLPPYSVCSDGARLNVATDGFWCSRNERAFFDVRVFNPLAPSNSVPSISAAYKNYEREKKQEYGARVREVEHSSFTPLSFLPLVVWDEKLR